MHTQRSFTVVAALVALTAACGQSSDTKGEVASSRVTKESIEKARAAVSLPMPVASARPKLVEVLGEPTSTDGESLIWAGVSGESCAELKLIVKDGTANGTTSGTAHKLMKDAFDKCAALAKGK